MVQYDSAIDPTDAVFERKQHNDSRDSKVIARFTNKVPFLTAAFIQTPKFILVLFGNILSLLKLGLIQMFLLDFLIFLGLVKIRCQIHNILYVLCSWDILYYFLLGTSLSKTSMSLSNARLFFIRLI